MFDLRALKQNYACISMDYVNRVNPSLVRERCKALFNFGGSGSSANSDYFSPQEETPPTPVNNYYETSNVQYNLSTVLQDMRARIANVLSNKPKVEVVEETEPQTEIPQQEEVDGVILSDINGELDGVIKQGSTGDCWILSSLLAVSSTEKGKSLIKNSVTINSDKTVTVNFKGVNKSYTINANEISKYDTDNDLCDAMSNGDNDALVYELAVAKLRMDLADGKVITDKSFANYNNGRVYNPTLAIEGGYDVAMLYYLTGKAPTAIKLDSDKNSTYTALNYILNNVNMQNSAIVVDLKNGSSSANCVDGKTYDLTIDGIHSVAIKSLTQDTITILDSWDTSKEYTMTWEEFAGLNLSQIAYTNLE